MHRQYPAMIDRLRATLREVDEGLKSHPDYAVSREFRRFLVEAIRDLEARESARDQLNSAA